MTLALAAPGDVPTDKTQIKFYARRGDDLRDALKRAAADDQRSTSVMIERILVEWLEARGYLAKPGEAKPKAKTRGRR
jgi:hypothetical protein